MEKMTLERWVELVVVGAIDNAIAAHPHWHIDKRFRASIAKRAFGTLRAQMPAMLAHYGSANAIGTTGSLPDGNEGAPLSVLSKQSGKTYRLPRRGSGLTKATRAPLFSRQIWQYCASRIKPALLAKQHERAETLIEICRFVDGLSKAARLAKNRPTLENDR